MRLWRTEWAFAALARWVRAVGALGGSEGDVSGGHCCWWVGVLVGRDWNWSLVRCEFTVILMVCYAGIYAWRGDHRSLYDSSRYYCESRRCLYACDRNGIRCLMDWTDVYASVPSFTTPIQTSPFQMK
jgi:hypothetical protein